jgi:hypothetical protein
MVSAITHLLQRCRIAKNPVDGRLPAVDVRRCLDLNELLCRKSIDDILNGSLADA